MKNNCKFYFLSLVVVAVIAIRMQVPAFAGGSDPEKDSSISDDSLQEAENNIVM